ncbi:TetR/AcrR family transcriptional regulator [Microbacterium indicum]|uniref:TetR/AcrR family transcriptional regulator n=1 Tax=Microbacterium indicum TaxID=358100 RepID=UPI0005674195|nr:TetR/AcrR family transcriptional regulator [Microbacterium indicum]
MSESAPGLRAQKRNETRRRLVDAARTLTTERGLAGFTIEEACEKAGVSRRTFFNHFAQKEDAVLGIPLPREDDDASTHFLEADGDLADDLATYFAERFGALDVSKREARIIGSLVENEPKLRSRAFALMRTTDSLTISLVERRAGLPEGDPRAPVLVHLVGALNRVAVESLLDESEGTPTLDQFRTALRERLGYAREILSEGQK